MVDLRGYQLELLDQIDRTLTTRPLARVMVQLPTGAGKTFLAGEFLYKQLSGRKAVWLTHRKELADQTRKMLAESAVPASADIKWSPGTQAPTIAGDVVILMAQTLARRVGSEHVWADYGSNDILIIDEAHHATTEGYAKAMELWPGPVIGLTATPWRLSQQQGFNHLFEELICGPQIGELQRDGFLSDARVIMPAEKDRISVGGVDRTGEYSETGIEFANRGSEIWTAGALRFWLEHGENRQTIVYAVSVTHARNLLQLFRQENVSASLILGETEESTRTNIIRDFESGHIRVLINVAVATEGFDLPNAGCVLITRPTMSLALYMQMIGRGMRPKQKGGDCIVLDMAGNSLRHGLPNEVRSWSLEPRSTDAGQGILPQWCPSCGEMSPPAAHKCQHCGEPFGESCPRCGKWRVWSDWSLNEACQDSHDTVCNKCHHDAHIDANLPVTEQMQELAEPQQLITLESARNPFLKDLLEEEMQKAAGSEPQRVVELRQLIETRDELLEDHDRLWKEFAHDLRESGQRQDTLSRPERARRYVEWEKALGEERQSWQEELAALQARPIDKQLILNNAVNRVLQLLEAEAKQAGLFPNSSNQSVVQGDRAPSLRRFTETTADISRPSSQSNKGYRHPETGETLRLQDAFFSVATEEERRKDDEYRALPNPRGNRKSFALRKKVVLAAGFEPN